MARKDRTDQKILDVDASMQGTLTFKDPVNLRINGSFEGRLDTKGSLIIGENASVQADINGEEIVVGGKITGNITAQKSLQLLSRAHVVGDITSPVLSIEAGAVIQGKCQMIGRYADQQTSTLNADQLAKYLEVEVSNILTWADSGKIPAFKEGSDWRFDRARVDEWIAREKAK